MQKRSDELGVFTGGKVDYRGAGGKQIFINNISPEAVKRLAVHPKLTAQFKPVRLDTVLGGKKAVQRAGNPQMPLSKIKIFPCKIARVQVQECKPLIGKQRRNARTIQVKVLVPGKGVPGKLGTKLEQAFKLPGLSIFQSVYNPLCFTKVPRGRRASFRQSAQLHVPGRR